MSSSVRVLSMSRFLFRPLSAVACLLVSACDGTAPATPRAEPPPFDLEATRQVIAEQNARFTKAHLTGNVALIDSMFTADATAYPPGSAAVTGARAMHDFTVAYINAGLTEFREESTDFYGNVDLVVDAGSYVVTFGPDHVTERGKYLNVWTRTAGGWKIRSNMWNTDPTVPTAK